MESPAPTILFGAFDRHNFGDLLFPHIAAALLPGEDLIFAGQAERDLRHPAALRQKARALVSRYRMELEAIRTKLK